MVKKLILLFLVGYAFSVTCPPGYLEHHGDIDCIPENFYYNSSIQQAAYFFLEVSIEGSPINANDWVGAFNDNICVGARKWDTSQCGNGVCEVPVLGYDSQLTQGYMTSGLTPIFKIFKSSDLSYVDATPSDDIPWSNFATPIINSLSVPCIGIIDECGLCNGDNSTCTDCSGAINGSSLFDCAGMCGGSALEDCTGTCGGVAVVGGCDNVCGSTAIEDCMGTCAGIAVVGGCDNVCGSTAIEDCMGICGGGAVIDCSGSCGGSALEDCSGICNGENTISGCDNLCGSTAVLDACGICDSDIENNNSDWDNDGICDNIDLCIGEEDDLGNCIVLEGGFPQTIRLKQNYPNPFNPTTYLEFEIGEATHASLIIYDLNGNPIKKLIDRLLQTDSYRVSWDGKDESYNEVPSGIYIASLKYNYMISSTKLTLIK